MTLPLRGRVSFISLKNGDNTVAGASGTGPEDFVVVAGGVVSLF